MQHNQDEGVEQAPQPSLCANKCGFFASSAGLCSKCYRDQQMNASRQQAQQQAVAAVAAKPVEQQPAVASPSQAAPVEAPAPSASACAPAEVTSSSAGPSAALEPAPKAGPARCAHPDCRKKVGLTGFKCKCENVFCGAHRLAEDHSCPHDYKTQQRQKLAAQNPLVAAAKVQRI